MKFLVKAFMVGSLFCVAPVNADVESQMPESLENGPVGTPVNTPASIHQIHVIPVPVASSKVEGLCPAGAMCTVGGSIVTLKFNVPCDAKLGPVSTRLVQGQNGLESLAVSAVIYDDVQPWQFRCHSISQQPITLQFPNIFLTEKDIIDLNMVTPK